MTIARYILLAILVFLMSLAMFIYWTYASDYEVKDGITYEKVVPFNKNPLQKAKSRFSRKSEYVSDGTDKMRKQQYFWFSPPVKTEKEPKLPLIVILHGGSGFAYAGEFLTEHDIVSQFPSYILVPMAPAYTVWGGNYPLAWDSPELPYVIKLINKLKTKHNIDPNRVYIMGCSMGARGVFYAAKEYSDIFAAGIAISGNWNIEDASQMNKTPIFIMAGKKDSIIPIEQVRNLSSQIASNGIEVKYKEFNMGHNCPSSHYYTRDVWRWLFSKTLSSPSLNP